MNRKLCSAIFAFLVGVILLLVCRDFEKVGYIFTNIGAALITTAFICFFEQAVTEKNPDQCIPRSAIKKTRALGLEVIEKYNFNDEGMFFKHNERIFCDPKTEELRLLYRTGKNTFTNRDEELKSLALKGVKIRVIICDEPESKDTLERIDSINRFVLEQMGENPKASTIEVKKSKATPIAGVEIRDDICCVLPYLLFGEKKVESYRVIYRKTKNAYDCYSQWANHFENVWNKAK